MLEALKAWGVGILLGWIIGAGVILVRHWWVVWDVLYPLAMAAFILRFAGAVALSIYQTEKRERQKALAEAVLAKHKLFDWADRDGRACGCGLCVLAREFQAKGGG